MSDILDYDWINSRGQLYARLNALPDAYWWPVYDIEVQTGLIRIDVVGKLQVTSMYEVMGFKDDNGTEYGCDDFYCDGERATDAAAMAATQPSKE